jgi:hypothetical protein
MMNKQTKLLAEQAANELADLFSPGFFDDRMVNDVAKINKKFAELIVQKCAEVAGGDVGHLILEHFGIE